MVYSLSLSLVILFFCSSLIIHGPFENGRCAPPRILISLFFSFVLKAKMSCISLTNFSRAVFKHILHSSCISASFNFWIFYFGIKKMLLLEHQILRLMGSSTSFITLNSEKPIEQFIKIFWYYTRNAKLVLSFHILLGEIYHQSLAICVDISQYSIEISANSLLFLSAAACHCECMDRISHVHPYTSKTHKELSF